MGLPFFLDGFPKVIQICYNVDPQICRGCGFGGNPMNCDKCKDPIEPGEEREHHSRILCEDCYMDALSPARTCDPWAVHSAKSFARDTGGEVQLSEIQRKIIKILEETGGVEPRLIVERLQIRPADLEREIAALRHMEKVRGELREGKKLLRLW
jgi:hypothetical protein